MRKQTVRGLLLLAAMLLIGSAAYLALYELDNKYTAALPGGYGYNLLQSDPRQVAFLVDGWEYYPGQLLAPEDFAAGTTAAAYTYVGEYSNFSQHLGSPYGTATYRLRLVNQGQPVALALYLPELLCAGRVYIDGVLLGKQGYLEPYMPLVMDGVYAFTAGEDTEILIQCANYTHYYSGMYYPPAIGTPTAVARMITARLMVYGLLCFSALAVALYHLAQWLMSQDRLMRWMGLLSLAFALWVCYPFLRSLGVPSVRLLYGVEDISSNIVLLCAIQLAGELSGASVRWYHRRVAVPAGVGLCVFAAIFPFFILPCAPAFINCYGLILFLWNLLAALYLLLLAGYGLKAGQPLERCLLCAAGFYGLSLSVSVLMSERLEPIRGAWADEYGGFALVIGFSAMMVQRGMRLAQENRRLTLHLQEEVDQKTRGIERLLKERRDLLASLLHDLKNPLAALKNYAELMRSGGVALDRETASYLDALSERVETVGERLDLLQDFSRGERGLTAQKQLCLNHFLQAFYQANRPDMELSGIHFHLRLPRELLIIRGNEDRLQAALENLCYNALSFTPPDGVITLELTLDSSFAAISVRDSGRGIPPEDLPHLFEQGFTRRPDNSGEGLGLFIVRTVALEHGGTVEAASQPGAGSLFTLRLPLLAKAPPPKAYVP
ncbi:sensor histidine kinase [uncultured Flavonifractor sp.]|uniref:sensor histidine kinase n=1 Tax=uncultured Flavonifractor sp. TaxID=1193534 RepID=UPI0026385BF6|nr:HAMP domain-containing sensor histidine kinase [uncultured Flavonifractor sp.]